MKVANKAYKVPKEHVRADMVHGKNPVSKKGRKVSDIEAGGSSVAPDNVKAVEKPKKKGVKDLLKYASGASGAALGLLSTLPLVAASGGAAAPLSIAAGVAGYKKGMDLHQQYIG